MKTKKTIISQKKYDICGIGNFVIDYFANIEIFRSYISGKIVDNYSVSNGTNFINKNIINDFCNNGNYLSSEIGGAAFNTLYNSTVLGLNNLFCTQIGHNDFLLKCKNFVKSKNIDIVDLKKNFCCFDYIVRNILITDCDKRLMFSSENKDFIPNNILLENILNSKICYVEGYIINEELLNFFLKNKKIIENNNIKIAICLSSPKLINKKRNIFYKFVEISNLIFGNRQEFIELCENKDYNYFFKNINNNCEKYFIEILHTKGSIVYKTSKNNIIRTYKAESKVIDVCNLLGAGDAFVAGFLYSFLKNNSIKKNSLTGNMTSSIVMSKKTTLLDN